MACYGIRRPSVRIYFCIWITPAPSISATLKNYEIFDLICCFNRLTRSQAEKKLQLRWSDDFFYRYEKIKDKRAYAVSYGEKRWLTISLMLELGDQSRCFLLDEPTVGIDIQY